MNTWTWAAIAICAIVPVLLGFFIQAGGDDDFNEGE